ncbi:ABC transporter substrate-binding protein [Paenibacillaceae bacterium WGS1546]|uniref:ABC transporter substrate-binding protein n=1 Tax=Cohnella sp. WGS1546 TaxID=3366810 RepID=UPI00372CE8C7
MNRHKGLSRYIAAALACMLVMTVLAACGGENKADTDGNSEADKPKTRIIETVMGKVEIPAEPKRIVAQGYLATMLALDIKPIGAPFWDIESPHIKSLTDGIADIGTIEASNVEKILELDPDLIVTLSNDPVIYEHLNKIAPTLVYPYGTFEEAREEVRAFGEILGKEKEAEAWVASFDEAVAQAKEKIKGVVKEGETVSLMGGFNKDLYVYSHESWRGAQAIYEHLGLRRPPLVQEMKEADEPSKVISLESVADYMGDYLFLEAGENAGFNPGDPLWKELKPIKNDRVFILDTDYFWPYDPIAVKAQVDLVAEMLVERQK